MALIECRNLSLGYENETVAEGLNFKVNTGDYLCIVGENGSGKSTLMKTLLSLIKPKGGEIIFGDGLDRREIGYLPQQTAHQKDFPASVREIVLSGLMGSAGFHPFYSRADKEKAKKAMELMRISEFSERSYAKLSGGQQQRVLLARALCAADKLLLLDEPVAGLDPKVTKEMYDLIEGLNKKGISIIMISHDVAAAVKYASHILHMGDGIFFGTKEEFVSSSDGEKFIEIAKEA